MDNTTLAIGTAIRLTTSVGKWPTGSRGRVIPSPIPERNVINYADVNSTYGRSPYTGTPSVWVVMAYIPGVDALAKFPVQAFEIQEVK